MLRPHIYQTTLQTFCVVACVVVCSHQVVGQQLTHENYDRLVPQGKEIDAIVGDFALGNQAAKAVVAFPSVTRNSNMTVRRVGGCLIDFATTEYESDQLSAFYPGAGVFRFSKGRFDQGSVTVTSPGTQSKPKCDVRYEFKSKRAVIEVTTTWQNTTGKDYRLKLQDNIRLDGGNERIAKTRNGLNDIYYINDIFWQQAYAFRAEGFMILSRSGARENVLTYEPLDGKPVVIKPGESYKFSRQIVVGKHVPRVLAIAESLADGTKSYPCELQILDADGEPARYSLVQLKQGKLNRGHVQTDSNGNVLFELPKGTYSANASIAGVNLFADREVRVGVATKENRFKLRAENYRPGTLNFEIVDGDGNPIPAKVEFKGVAGTQTPNWGPDSAEHFVRNLAYTENGRVRVSMQKGEYDVIVSRGPEYDAKFARVTVQPQKTVDMKVALKLSVQTPGWVSGDFHSHSSPSGDNTGSQLGRVLNLAAENIEFAPCTEHNRISSYSGHIEKLGLEPFLATVTGMELTGQPLPLNHQNVFPLKHFPRTQDGGGPTTDSSPETQLERITMWDDRSEKLVQQNHPDMGWLFYDKNGDGSPDKGYWRSFRLMDVVEIHPIDKVLNLTRYTTSRGQPNANHRIANWLQLLNQGFRVYGVVNTDAHYNFHGSGWLRNWIQSSTDDPKDIDPIEMVHASEQGRLIMSNGPYLEATFSDSAGNNTIVSGQDLVATDGSVSVHVRVQCPNWIDIDRVFLLINGRHADEYSFTRSDNSEMFSDGVLKFDHTFKVALNEDSHIVVVTGHPTATLGPVLGPRGSQHPAALTNPVFVDIDGKGFVPNRDTLGFPLPVKFIKPK